MCEFCQCVCEWMNVVCTEDDVKITSIKKITFKFFKYFNRSTLSIENSNKLKNMQDHT